MMKRLPQLPAISASCLLAVAGLPWIAPPVLLAQETAASLNGQESSTAQPSPAPAPVKPAKATAGVKPGPAGSGTADPAMAGLEAQYAAERTADLLAGLARYADELTALQKSLLTAGDTAGAARIQLELDRVLPVLVPVKAEPAADDFSIFEETEPAPGPATLPADTATPGDLETLLKALQPQPPSKTSGPGTPPPPAGKGTGTASGPGGAPGKTEGAPVKTARRLLKMSSAQLNGSWLPDLGYLYWIGTGQRALWTLDGLPATPCNVVLRYACDDKEGGGKLSVRLGETKIEIEVPPTGGWSRYRDLPVGTLANAANRADLVLEVASLKTGATSLMDLKAVMVIPSEHP
jgi:hypothetical protein